MYLDLILNLNVVAQEMEESIDLMARWNSPVESPCQTGPRSHNDNRRRERADDAASYQTVLVPDWQRTPMIDRDRFWSTPGNRSAGRLSTCSDSRRSGSHVTLRSPNHHSVTYRSHRTDRERVFLYSRATTTNGRPWPGVPGSFAMHADSASVTPAEDAKATEIDASAGISEINANNSRAAPDNNIRGVNNESTVTPKDTNDCSVAGNASPAVLKRSSAEPLTIAAKTSNVNNSNNNSCADHDNNNYYTVSPAECSLMNELDNTNNNAAGDWATQKRGDGSRRCRLPGRLNGRRQRRSAAALKAISCSTLEVDAFLRQLESDRLQPDVELLACVLDEYRTVLGLDGQRSVEAWPAAWRLARLPAGRWVVSEVLKHARESLSKFQSVKPSEFCRRGGLAVLGLALLDGVDDSLRSRLVGSVSVELEQVVLQRAVSSVVQALVNMTSSKHHYYHHQQQSVC